MTEQSESMTGKRGAVSTVEGVPVFAEKKELESYMGGRDLEKIRTLLDTNEGKMQLLRELQQKDAKIADLQKAMDQIKLNTEQLQKKESFLKKVAMFPIRHPFLTLAGIAGTVYGLHALGFQLPAVIEAILAKVPLSKIKDFVGTIFSRGSGTIGGEVAPNLPTVSA